MPTLPDPAVRRDAAGGRPRGWRLGIIGGGQLARMTALAAYPLGIDVAVLERAEDCPAGPLAADTVVGDYGDVEALARLAAGADVVTVENEFIDAALLAELERRGARLLPTAESMRLVQDKLLQKQTLAAAGLAVPRFRAVEVPADVVAAAADFGWPLLLKARRNGYDGKGNATVAGPAEVEAAWQALGGRGLYVEEHCPFEKELAVIVTRSRTGDTAAYPVVETVQRDHVCHEVTVPAAVALAARDAAAGVALRAIEAVGGTGTFGVELFLLPGDRVVVNELAPRVHNSGHYTIEAALCSQFENHVRAVFGLPLGSTSLVAPAAAMVNLLGTGPGPGAARGLEAALAVPGAHLHLYGKRASGRGRKMGHVTALGDTVEDALARARAAAGAIGFGDPR